MPSIRWVEDALLLPCSGRPRTELVWQIDGGVFDATGASVEPARHRGERLVEHLPALPAREALPLKPGAFLFGGWLQRHFGHLLVSLGRLWALPELGGQLRAVVFLRLPDDNFHDPSRDPLRAAHVADLLRLLGVGEFARLRMVREPLRVARLAVPDSLALGRPGSSAEDSAAWLAIMRRMARAPGLPPAAGPRLYVSRRWLAEGYGRTLFEEVLEENLAREGYAILHPERMSIPEQIAAYAGAREAIFAESSAIHLAIGVMDPAARMAVVARRRPAAASLTDQLRATPFAGAPVIDVLRGAVMTLDRGRLTAGATFSALSVPDLAALRDQLAAAGFCKGRGWRVPTEADVAARIAEAVGARQRLFPQRQVVWVPGEMLGRGGSVPAAVPATPAAGPTQPYPA
jgi:GNAT superfamily N-acetyltransferase